MSTAMDTEVEFDGFEYGAIALSDSTLAALGDDGEFIDLDELDAIVTDDDIETDDAQLQALIDDMHEPAVIRHVPDDSRVNIFNQPQHPMTRMNTPVATDLVFHA